MDGQPAAGGRLSTRVAAVLGIGVMAFALRAVTTGHFRTADETVWLQRSSRFADALTHGHFADASPTSGAVTTMPGVTTMWIGSVAKGIWKVGRELRLWGSASSGYTMSGSGLRLAQLGMAAATSALIGLLVVLLWRWAGGRAAVIAGLFLATEPFLVAHGSVLHTDELMSLAGVAGLVATALALGVPRETTWAYRWWAGAAAGSLWALALLTKVSALYLLPGVGLLVAYAVARRWIDRAPDGAARDDLSPADRGPDVARPADPSAPRPSLGDLVRVLAAWGAAAAVVVLALYPALWAAPHHELSLLRRSALLGETSHAQFFLGRITETPGWDFYAVALPLRMTPWFLVAAVAALAYLVTQRPLRPDALALAAMAVPPLVVLSAAAKQFDRYGLPLLVLAAVAVGVAGSAVLDGLRSRGLSGRRVVAAGGAAGALLFAHAATVAPWGLAYFNPVLGGSSTASRALLVGWGEGLGGAGDVIAAREAGRCDQVTIWSYKIVADFPCGRIVGDEVDDPTYSVLYVSQRQRSTPGDVDHFIGDRELVATVKLRGITYAEVYGPGGAAGAALAVPPG